MRLGGVSGTHGNRRGLEAVLADIERHGPFDGMLMAGDLASGGPRPAETLARIQTLRCPVVLGNTDYYLFADDQALDEASLTPSERQMVAWAADRIGLAGLAYLRSLPRSLHIDGPAGGVRLVH